MSSSRFDYDQLSRAILAGVQAEQASLNQADPANHNHGDHLVAIGTAVQTALDSAAELPAPQKLRQTSAALEQLQENGSAPLYQQILLDLAGRMETTSDFEGELLRLASRLVHPPPEAQNGLRSTLGGVFRRLLRRTASVLDLNQMAEQLGVGGLFAGGLDLLEGTNDGTTWLDAAITLIIQRCPLAAVPHRARGAQVALRAALLELDRQAHLD